MDPSLPRAVDPQWWQQVLPRLRSFVQRRLRPELAHLEAPSDIVQSACRELLADLTVSVAGDGVALRWQLFRRSLRKIVSKHRYHAAQKRRRDAHREWPGVDAVVDATTGPLDRIVLAERQQRLAAAMQKLTPNHQRVIEWVHFDGVTHADVGRRLGRSEDASKMLLYRAMARLAELLGGGEGEAVGTGGE